MIKTNYHTHTTRCKHAEGLDEEYVIAAINAGFTEIGFSDHAPWPKLPIEFQAIRMDVSEFPDYFQSIKRLQRQYANKIKINIGLEAEYYPDRMDYMKKLLEENIIDTKELENEIQQLNKNIRAEIDKIHDEKKGSISIQKKPMSKTNCECTLFFPCCYPPKLYN